MNMGSWILSIYGDRAEVIGETVGKALGAGG